MVVTWWIVTFGVVVENQEFLSGSHNMHKMMNVEQTYKSDRVHASKTDFVCDFNLFTALFHKDFFSPSSEWNTV